MSAKLDEIASRFENVRQTGAEQYIGRCPAHEDNRESLSIGLGDNGDVVLHCHAGCKTEHIVHEVGLKMSDLFERNGHHGNGHANGNGHGNGFSSKIVAQYRYCDERGVLLFEAVRMVPKDFRQRKPKPEGGWDWSTKGVRQVPYRLPELLEGDPAKPVFIVEGEKDCDNLVKLGFVATCNAGGAGKWRKCHAEHLAGRNVVILPDNDDPGRQHALTVAKSLQGLATSIKIIKLPQLPPKGDVSDWIELGGTRQILLDMVESAEPWQCPPEEAKHHGHGGKSQADGDPAEVTNGVIEYIETKPGSEKFREEVEPLPIDEVQRRILAATGDWPRRIDNAMFVDDEQHGVAWLGSPAAMFGWLSSKLRKPIAWHKTRGTVTKEEIFHELRRTATKYLALETLPHHPPLDGHYYSHRDYPSGNGSHFRQLLDRFNPATDIDRDLMQAGFMTPFWGGHGGARPVFVITTQDGPGSGKSKFVSMVGHLTGGILSFDRAEELREMRTRLLSPDASTKRVCLLDNIKSDKFSWGELEGFITTQTISGHRMYAGEGSRPNTLTWFLTLNGANLSTDMAQRSVIIRLKKPKYDGDWEEQTRRFIDQHRKEIIGDILGILRGPGVELKRCSRWGDWDKSVLARLPEPEEALRVIADRQGECDAEQEQNLNIEEYFEAQLKRLGYDTKTAKVFIPSLVACRWVNSAANERSSVTAVSRMLRRMIAEKRFKCLIENTCNAHGRGFLWAGTDCNGSNTYIDINMRLARQREYEEASKYESQESQDGLF